jgi:hypothetical protein
MAPVHIVGFKCSVGHVNEYDAPLSLNPKHKEQCSTCTEVVTVSHRPIFRKPQPGASGQITAHFVPNKAGLVTK